MSYSWWLIAFKACRFLVLHT